MSARLFAVVSVAATLTVAPLFVAAPAGAGDVAPGEVGSPLCSGVGINVLKSIVEVPPTRARRMKRNSAFFIGDSLTFQAWVGGKMQQRVRNRHLAWAGVEARGGYTTGAMLNVVRRQRWRANMPSRVLIALGTNDAWSGTPPEVFQQQLGQLINLVRTKVQPRRIVLVNISAKGKPDVYAWSLKLNAIINQFRRQPIIQVLDWSRQVNLHPNWINPCDPLRIHLTQAGMNARANLYFNVTNKL